MLKSYKHLPYITRKINGKSYCCYDIGCPDFEQAARNRKIIKNKDYITGYLQAEVSVTKTPLGQALATWIPTGELPTIAKEVWRELSGVHVEDFDEGAMKAVARVLTRYAGDGV